jgi:hypothetical protein
MHNDDVRWWSGRSEWVPPQANCRRRSTTMRGEPPPAIASQEPCCRFPIRWRRWPGYAVVLWRRRPSGGVDPEMRGAATRRRHRHEYADGVDSVEGLTRRRLRAATHDGWAGVAMEEATTCGGGDDERGQRRGLGTVAVEGSRDGGVGRGGGGKLPAVGVHLAASLECSVEVGVDASERTEEAGAWVSSSGGAVGFGWRVGGDRQGWKWDGVVARGREEIEGGDWTDKIDCGLRSGEKQGGRAGAGARAERKKDVPALILNWFFLVVEIVFTQQQKNNITNSYKVIYNILKR